MTHQHVRKKKRRGELSKGAQREQKGGVATGMRKSTSMSEDACPKMKKVKTNNERTDKRTGNHSEMWQEGKQAREREGEGGRMCDVRHGHYLLSKAGIPSD